MKSLFMVVLALCAVSTNLNASEFDQGAPEYDERPITIRTEAEIFKSIQDEMVVACQGNMCQIVGSDNEGSSWTVSFSVGYGQVPGGGSGNSIYIGDQSNGDRNRGFAGITVTYKNYKCKTNLRVTPAVYQFVNTYMYNMINHDYSTKRNFSPAEQTVVLFYTTMLNRVEACRSGNQ